jgi:hypothetical protein
MYGDRHVILGVHVTNRTQQVAELQAILSQYGCLIKTRLGLHETSKDSCSKAGVLLLELLDDEEQVLDLTSELSKIDGVEVASIVFDHV